MILLFNAHHCGFNCLSNFISPLLFLSIYFLSPQHLNMAPKGNLKWNAVLRIEQPSFISIRAAVVTCKGPLMSVILMDEIPSQMEVASKKGSLDLTWYFSCCSCTSSHLHINLAYLHLGSLSQEVLEYIGYGGFTEGRAYLYLQRSHYLYWGETFQRYNCFHVIPALASNSLFTFYKSNKLVGLPG